MNSCWRWVGLVDKWVTGSVPASTQQQQAEEQGSNRGTSAGGLVVAADISGSCWTH